MLAGSSNFTSPGLGLGAGEPNRKTRVNLEANLVYWASRRGDRSLVERLTDPLPEDAEELDPAEVRLQFQEPKANADESGPEGLVELPWFFRRATYSVVSGGPRLVLVLEGATPDGFRLCEERDGRPWKGEGEWVAAGRPGSWSVEWERAWPPSGFGVTWNGCEGSAWLPVNVEDAASLPPPDELKGLPLDALIEILSSARPLHIALRHWYHREKSKEPKRSELDPLKRFDDSGLLLRRTRRMSWALLRLRDRLQKPVPTESALHWRLEGPVGVRALVDAVGREARSAEERDFLTAEVALELSRVRPTTALGCLSVQRVRGRVKKLARELVTGLQGGNGGSGFRAYLAKVAGEVGP